MTIGFITNIKVIGLLVQKLTIGITAIAKLYDPFWNTSYNYLYSSYILVS